MKPVLRVADLFCGMGGTSEGLRRACAVLGIEMDAVAVNHWPRAIETHRANHPNARHFCTGVDLVSPRELVPGGVLDLLIASPSCVHHSNARGGRPRQEQDRASAWCVMRWISELHVKTILIENVPEFRSWGPLDGEGRAIKERKGAFFQSFVRGLEDAGYWVQHRVINCADYGDPTTRKRLFLIASLNGPILWPEPSHRDPSLPSSGLFDDKAPWRTAREIIDWSLPSQSIFDRKKPLAEKTLRRIYAGLSRFGGPNAEPFLVLLRNHMAELGLDNPLPALTAGGNHVALCEPVFLGRGGPEGSAKPSSVDDPLGTVMTANRRALCEPVVVNLKGQSTATPVAWPTPTQTASAAHLYLADPVLLTYHGGVDGDDRSKDLDVPVPTIDCSNRHGLVEPVLIPNFGERDGQELRAHSLNDPLPTVTSHGAGMLAEAFVLPHEMFSLDGADSIDAPMRTITASNGRGNKLCEAVVVSIDQSGSNGLCASSVDDPLAKMTTKARFAVADPVLVDCNYGNETERDDLRRAHSLDAPLGTVTTQKSKAVAEPVVVRYNNGDIGHAADVPLGTITTKDRFGILETDAGPMRLDIRLRMLRPHELAKAMSMDGYEITGTMQERVRQIGNAVPACTAQALCGAILGSLRLN